MSDFLDEYGYTIMTVIISSIAITALCGFFGYSGDLIDAFKNHITSITGG